MWWGRGDSGNRYETNQVERLAPSGVGEMSISMSKEVQPTRESSRLVPISEGGGGPLLECSGRWCRGSASLWADVGLAVGRAAHCLTSWGSRHSPE